MARKNIFGIDDHGADHDPAAQDDAADFRPLAHFERPLNRSGPVGALSRSLGGISEKAQRAVDLERQLAQGQVIVELDPQFVDSSFVPDRLGVNAADQDMLQSQIREHGQQVPILVRPHPEANGRFQVAYGHRRLAAVKQLGMKVRAVVRDLSDEQLVVSQGQENNARTDLSFIERAFFSHRLEQHGFSRDVIMSSLGVDKAALSRMIALVGKLPATLIEAIGSAPGIGRTRWAEIAELVEDPLKKANALKVVLSPALGAMSSDERFEYVFEQLRSARQKPRTSVWSVEGRPKVVRISETEDRLSLVFDKAAVPNFGAYVERRLETLYREFIQKTETGD
jgi:ParB family chromosome partitioning protein